MVKKDKRKRIKNQASMHMPAMPEKILWGRMVVFLYLRLVMVRVSKNKGMLVVVFVWLWGCGEVEIAGLAADGSLTQARLDSFFTLSSGVNVHRRKEIRAHPERVWVVLSDFNRWSDWNSNIIEMRSTEGESFEWGLHFTQRLATRPTTLTLQGVIVRYIPGREIVWKGSGLRHHVLSATSITPGRDGWTEVVWRLRLVGPGVSLLEGSIRRWAEAAIKDAVEGLAGKFNEPSPAPESLGIEADP